MRPLACSTLLLIAAFSQAEQPTGWTDLLKTGADSPWKSVDKGWIPSKDVKLAEMKNRLAATPEEMGTIWVNGPTGRLPNLITKESFGDCVVHVEFLIAQKSNSGIKFNEVYEIQILDTAGQSPDELSGDLVGGIDPRDKSDGRTDRQRHHRQIHPEWPFDPRKPGTQNPHGQQLHQEGSRDRGVHAPSRPRAGCVSECEDQEAGKKVTPNPCSQTPSV